MVLVELAQLVRLQFLFGHLKLRLKVLLEKFSKGSHEDKLVFPELDEALEHVNDVVVFHL